MAVSLSNFYVLNEPNVLPSNASTKFSGTSLLASKLQICASPSTHLRNLGSVKRDSVLRSEASRKSQQLTQELQTNQMSNVGTVQEKDLFVEMKDRFLSFKRHSYMENLDHFQILAKGQAPKFMVVACADSRVCPSNILGFKPGEAFTVRSVANLVPEFESGPSETKAGLEFSVNSLEVENILVIGHSCCGGIRALMSMQDEVDSSSFIQNWVVIGNNARLSTKAATANLSFEKQCRHCEKESVNRSLLNLLTYPWIEERVRKGLLSIHGGYYDFVNCSFEKWTLNYNGSSVGKEGKEYSIKDRQFWS